VPSPTVLIIGLVILWIIVVGPMIVRRPSDAGAQSRSATRRRAGTADAEQAISTTGRPHSFDANELTDARRRMVARRRRSLWTIIGALVISNGLALFRGGLLWLVAALCFAGLAGYLYFLRVQARRARQGSIAERFEAREVAALSSPVHSPRPAPLAHNVVAIDDEDLALEGMDTIDLTGLYEQATVVTAHPRAS
jgi:hypothetical protein